MNLGLSHVTFCMNTSFADTTKKSPYEIVFGQKARPNNEMWAVLNSQGVVDEENLPVELIQQINEHGDLTDNNDTDISTNNENETSIFRIEDDPLLVTLTIPDQEGSTLVSLPVSHQENLSSVNLSGPSKETPSLVFLSGSSEETPSLVSSSGSSEETPSSVSSSGPNEETPSLVSSSGPSEETPSSVSSSGPSEETPLSVNLFRRSEEDPTILFSPVRVAQFASTLLSPVYPTPPTNKRQRTRLVSKGKANTKTFRKMYDTFWTDSPVCQTKCIVG